MISRPVISASKSPRLVKAFYGSLLILVEVLKLFCTIKDNCVWFIIKSLSGLGPLESMLSAVFNIVYRTQIGLVYYS